jgi:hypothetical protein
MKRTLAEARHIVEADRGRSNVQPVSEAFIGKFVIYLERNHYGYHCPCVAKLIGFTPSGRVKIDMFGHGEQVKIVSRTAVFRDDTCNQYDLNGNPKD